MAGAARLLATVLVLFVASSHATPKIDRRLQVLGVHASALRQSDTVSVKDDPEPMCTTTACGFTCVVKEAEYEEVFHRNCTWINNAIKEQLATNKTAYCAAREAKTAKEAEALALKRNINATCQKVTSNDGYSARPIAKLPPTDNSGKIMNFSHPFTVCLKPIIR